MSSEKKASSERKMGREVVVCTASVIQGKGAVKRKK